MMVVGMSPANGGLRPNRPRELFAWDTKSRGVFWDYDVASDGRFLMVRAGDGATITLVLNWFEKFEGKLRKADE